MEELLVYSELTNEYLKVTRSCIDAVMSYINAKIKAGKCHTYTQAIIDAHMMLGFDDPEVLWIPFAKHVDKVELCNLQFKIFKEVEGSETEDKEEEMNEKEVKILDFQVMNVTVDTENISEPVTIVLKTDHGERYVFSLTKENVYWLISALRGAKKTINA